MNRRGFLKTCGAAAGIAAFSGSDAIAGIRLANSTMNAQIGKRRPNVIYILTDDLGYGDVGCFGQQLIETPCIDQLAAEGLMFTDHYAGNTVCAPSRCSLLTGLHPGHCLIRDNIEIDIPSDPEELGYQLALPAGTVTVGHVFQQAGYKTGCIGKWGLGGPLSTGRPDLMGFHHFFGYLGQRQAHNYYFPTLWRDTEETSLGLVPNTGYSHDLMTDEALSFINKYKDNPFFLYLAYTIPHRDFQITDLAQYADKGWTDDQKKQAAMISRMDRDTGRIMDLLKNLGLDDNTLVMFTSDNGPHAFNGTNELFNANGPLNGKKTDLYDGGIRVPLIARWPGKVKPATKTNHISAFWDFLPTCCDLLGVKTPKVMWSSGTWTRDANNLFWELTPNAGSWHEPDGISYLPALLGKDSLQQKHDYLYWEFKATTAQAVRKGNWKLVRNDPHLVNPSSDELYNLETDIGEQTNLSSTQTAKLNELREHLQDAHICNPNFKGYILGDTC